MMRMWLMVAHVGALRYVKAEAPCWKGELLIPLGRTKSLCLGWEVRRPCSRAWKRMYSLRRFDFFGAWLPTILIVFVALALLFGWHK